MLGKLCKEPFRYCCRLRNCRLCSSQNTKNENKSVTKLSLKEPIPWLPRPVYAKSSDSIQETKVTTLENGLRVASESKFGSYCTVGVLVDSGSRFESAFPSGISHFLEKLAFGNTVNMNREGIMNTFDKLGGICDCQSSRDTLIYAASVEATGIEKAVDILGEVALRPLLTEEEITEARMAISFNLDTIKLSPEKDTILIEMIHSAGYVCNTLGLPKICPVENITKIDRDVLFTYLNYHHSPDRMVLAGVGVEHDLLVEQAQKYFVDKRPIWEEDSSLNIQKSMLADNSYAQYTGGICKEEADLSNVSIGPNPLPELAHMVLGLQSVGHQHPDFITCCVLNMLMGGGGSFSAGGPGKGMYTRLYTNVLNRYHWMHNATAFNHAYIDTGLFCIHASAHPTHLGDLVRVITKEFVGMAGDMEKQDLERAKRQLQSMLLMNLESRPVVFEDIGRQVLATGKRIQPQQFIDLINKVTADDVVSVANKMLQGKPSVAALGSLGSLPSVVDIEAGLLDKGGKLKSRSKFSIFR